MSYENILASELSQLLRDEQPLVFDIRDANSFKQGHIDGAQQPTDTAIRRLVRGREHDRPIVVYCYHGISSRDFAVLLAGFGFRRIFNLEGGWQAWQGHLQSA